MNQFLPNLVFTRGWIVWLVLLAPILIFVPARFAGKRRPSIVIRLLRTAVLMLLLICTQRPARHDHLRDRPFEQHSAGFRGHRKLVGDPSDPERGPG